MTFTKRCQICLLQGVEVDRAFNLINEIIQTRGMNDLADAKGIHDISKRLAKCLRDRKVADVIFQHAGDMKVSRHRDIRSFLKEAKRHKVRLLAAFR